MPNQNTAADSIAVKYTGAASDGAAQTDPSASLGSFISSTEVSPLAMSAPSLPTNITLVRASAVNGIGAGSLNFPSVGAAQWRAPGSATYGTSVSIANGETKQLQDGEDENAYIVISRTSTANLTGTAAVNLSILLNNCYDDVNGNESSLGDDEYRSYGIENESTLDVTSLKVYSPPLAAAVITDTADLDASGAGTLQTTGSFASFPASGMAAIFTSGGTLREVVYYSARADDELTVPAAGRAALGTTAAAGAATDTVAPVSPIRVALEAPTADEITESANESTAPAAITFTAAFSAADAVTLSTLASGAWHGLHTHREVVAGSVALAEVLGHLAITFDSAN